MKRLASVQASTAETKLYCRAALIIVAHSMGDYVTSVCVELNIDV
jgi:hypothetical protein